MAAAGRPGYVPVTAYLTLARPLLKRISDARLARLIEEHTPAAEDRLVTAVEYSNVARAPLISNASGNVSNQMPINSPRR